MKVFYKFNDDTTSLVEVNDDIATVIQEYEKYEEKINKREHRHCYSYNHEDFNEEYVHEFAVEDKRSDDDDEPMSSIDRLHIAISHLKPAQKELVKAIYFDGMTQEEYAEKLGVSQVSVSKRLKVVKKKLKEFF